MIQLSVLLNRIEVDKFEPEFELDSNLLKIYFANEDYKYLRKKYIFKQINNEFNFFVDTPVESYVSGKEQLQLFHKLICGFTKNSNDPIIDSLQSLVEVAFRLDTGVFFKKVGEYYDPSPWRKFVNLLGRK